MPRRSRHGRATLTVAMATAAAVAVGTGLWLWNDDGADPISADRLEELEGVAAVGEDSRGRTVVSLGDEATIEEARTVADAAAATATDRGVPVLVEIGPARFPAGDGADTRRLADLAWAVDVVGVTSANPSPIRTEVFVSADTAFERVAAAVADRFEAASLSGPSQIVLYREPGADADTDEQLRLAAPIETLRASIGDLVDAVDRSGGRLLGGALDDGSIDLSLDIPDRADLAGARQAVLDVFPDVAALTLHADSLAIPHAIHPIDAAVSLVAAIEATGVEVPEASASLTRVRLEAHDATAVQALPDLIGGPDWVLAPDGNVELRFPNDGASGAASVSGSPTFVAEHAPLMMALYEAGHLATITDPTPTRSLTAEIALEARWGEHAQRPVGDVLDESDRGELIDVLRSAPGEGPWRVSYRRGGYAPGTSVSVAFTTSSTGTAEDVLPAQSADEDNLDLVIGLNQFVAAWNGSAR